MAQVDASRFISNLAALFAPDIKDNQQFTAYLDEVNSFTIQADNVASNFSALESQLLSLTERISALESSYPS